MKDKIKTIKTYILDRAQEPSTWRGITLMLTAMGASIDYDRAELIMFVGVFFAGMIGALFPDKK